MKKCGFTLIELLVVIAILAILVTLGSKGLRNARISARKAQAMVEIKSIETAVKAYFNEYGKLPVEADDQGEGDPEASVEFSAEIIDILTAENMDDNRRELVFLEPQTASSGEFLDPWNVPYLIMMDTDYDGIIDVDVEGLTETIRRKVAIVSVGLYQLKGDSATADDIIRSWE